MAIAMPRIWYAATFDGYAFMRLFFASINLLLLETCVCVAFVHGFFLSLLKSFKTRVTRMIACDRNAEYAHRNVLMTEQSEHISSAHLPLNIK